MKHLSISILLLWSTYIHQDRKHFKLVVPKPVNYITLKLRIGDEIPVMVTTYEELGIELKR